MKKVEHMIGKAAFVVGVVLLVMASMAAMSHSPSYQMLFLAGTGVGMFGILMLRTSR